MQTKAFFLFFCLMLFGSMVAYSQNAVPVTPNPSPEAKALLELIYSISGNHLLSGQHNFPISRDRNSQFAASYIGKTPVVWSQDFGFAADGDKDSYLARPSIVEEAIRQHQLGSIITLCWHAVPPTLEVLKTQPGWVLYVIWSGMAKGTPKALYDSFVEDPFVLFREDEAYIRLVNPFREVSGLSPLNKAQAADFSGLWVLNEYESKIERTFGAGAPHKMNIIQVEDVLAVESYSEVEWSDDRIGKQLIKGDGSDMVTKVFNAPRTQNAN